jgi:hypothetical protein
MVVTTRARLRRRSGRPRDLTFTASRGAWAQTGMRPTVARCGPPEGSLLCSVVLTARPAGSYPSREVRGNNGIVLARQQGWKPDGGAAGAAAEALAYLFPKDEPAIRARLAGETAAICNALRPDFAAGVEIGRQAAAAMGPPPARASTTA